MIHILTTGGTIEGLDYVDGQGTTQSNINIQGFLDKANIGFDYTIESVFKKDSRAITNDDRELLVCKIKESTATKILITHGTFTMENTTKYLGRLNLKKTIVLVGSFILGSSAETDNFHSIMLQKLYNITTLRTTRNYQANFIYKNVD